MCGSIKKAIKKAVGKVLGAVGIGGPDKPEAPPPPAVQVEAPAEESKEVDTKESTESEVKSVRARGKKGLTIKRSRIGQGLNI